MRDSYWLYLVNLRAERAADVVDEPLEIELHFQRRVPGLKGEHGLPVEPEVGVVEIAAQHLLDALVVELLVRREEQLHQRQRGLVAQLKAVFGVGALAPVQDGPVHGEVGVVVVQPVELVQHAGIGHFQRGDGAEQVPQAFVVVFHLPSAPDDEPHVRPQQPVAGAAGQFGLLQNVDVAAFHAAVPDEKGRGGKARKPSAHQPGLSVLRALGLAGAGERFIISVGVIHCVPPVRRALPGRC